MALTIIQPTIAHVDNFIKSEQITTEIWTITPVIASYITDNLNNGNRPKKNANITRMKDAMRDDIWRMTGDTIKFSADGDASLKDGQNRLFACKAAGVPFTTVVMSGIPAQSFDAMDTGVGRSPNDIFKLADIKQYQDMAGASKWMNWIVNKPMTNRITPSPQVLLKSYQEKWTGLYDANTDHVKGVTRFNHTKHPKKLLIALNFCFREANAVMAENFFRDWSRQVNSSHPKKLTDDRHPPIAVQSFLGERITNSDGRYHDRLRMLVIVTAWNAYYKGKAVSNAEMKLLTPQTEWPGIAGTGY